VLLVDLDPQGHASLHLGVQLGNDQPSIYDVLVSGLPAARAFHNITEHLVVLPAGVDLVGAELELAAREGREHVLARALAPYQSTFDFCLVDCPPSLGVLTINALAAVQELVIPLQPHFLALEGLGRLLETVALVRRALNPRLRVSGIALCMFEKGTRLAQEVLDDISRFLSNAGPADPWFGARVFDTKIRRNIKLAESPSFGKTVYDYAPSSHGAEDYLALAAEVMALSAPPAPPVARSAVESAPMAFGAPVEAQPAGVPPGRSVSIAPATEELGSP